MQGINDFGSFFQPAKRHRKRVGTIEATSSFNAIKTSTENVISIM